MTTLPGVRVAWRAVPPGVDRRTVSRALLAELLPTARFVSRCPSCGGEHGRVRVEGADAAVSVSYAPGWTVVAVTREHARIGVDAVPADAAGLERVLADGSDAGSWARVEAVLKADGRGLAVDPARVRIERGEDGWSAQVSGTRVPGVRVAGAQVPGARVPGARVPGARVPGARVPGARVDDVVWRGTDVEAPPGIVAAVAIGL